MAGHGEKGETILRANLLQITPSEVTETSPNASGVGMIKLSGVKLFLADGTSWNEITSA